MELQLAHKWHKNEFAFYTIKHRSGKIMFDIQIVRFNPATIENEPLDFIRLPLAEFSNWAKNWQAVG
jgi:hypothetical protein